MKPPRIRIPWIMVAVAIAALNFGAILALLPRHEHVLDDQRGVCLSLGALPMANVLAAGFLIRQHRPGSRPFLLGFEAFGAMALTLFFGLAISSPHEFVKPYLELFLSPIATIIGQDHPCVLIPIQCFVAVVLLGWPQLAVALVGGFLSSTAEPE
jgi:hypothetical protein